MRGANTLVPARFLSLIAHLCVLIGLLWESQQSVRHCLPSQFQDSHYHTFHTRLLTGYAVSITLACAELVTFISGLTMFSPTATLTSIACHSIGAITLTYFILDSWLCDTFWIIFFFSSFIPATTDIIVAAMQFVIYCV